MKDTDTLRKIHRRQIARLLDHLKRTGQSTPVLEQDIKRSFGYVFQDVEKAVQQGYDEENKCNESNIVPVLAVSKRQMAIR